VFCDLGEDALIEAETPTELLVLGLPGSSGWRISRSPRSDRRGCRSCRPANLALRQVLWHYLAPLKTVVEKMLARHVGKRD
jgi:hypothetical protein